LHLDTVTPHPHYHLSQSLFDPGGPENQGEHPKFVFDPEEHMQLYTEQYALKKYGAFWLDYLFTMEDTEDERKDKQSKHIEYIFLYLYGVIFVIIMIYPHVFLN